MPPYLSVLKIPQWKTLVNRARSKDRAQLNFLKRKRQGTLAFAFLLWYHILATQIKYVTFAGNGFLFWQKPILRFAFPVSVEDLCSNKWSCVFRCVVPFGATHFFIFRR